MYTYEYDNRYLPGMPVADILIGQPNKEPELPLVAIVGLRFRWYIHPASSAAKA